VEFKLRVAYILVAKFKLRVAYILVVEFQMRVVYILVVKFKLRVANILVVEFQLNVTHSFITYVCQSCVSRKYEAISNLNKNDSLTTTIKCFYYILKEKEVLSTSTPNSQLENNLLFFLIFSFRRTETSDWRALRWIVVSGARFVVKEICFLGFFLLL